MFKKLSFLTILVLSSSSLYAQTVVVTSPNQVVSRKVDTKHNIIWASENSIESIKLEYSTNAGSVWICGSVNGDVSVTVSDVIYLINYLFKGGAAPQCPPSPYTLCADANGDGEITVSDVIYIINYLFKGGPPPICDSSPNIYNISIIDFAFVPETTYVGLGDSVRWTNNGSVPHTSTSNTGIWDSDTLNPGESFIYQFNSFDLYPYYCKIHPTMTGVIIMIPTSVDEPNTSNPRMRYSLSQNYPNPFNPECVIEYALPNDCNVKLSVHNILGQKVKVLVDEYQHAGNKSVKWDGRDESGNVVASGIYFYRIQAGEFKEVKKMVFIK